MRHGQKQKVVVIGCGNVAWHLVARLSVSKKFAVEVYNHRRNPALYEMKELFGVGVTAGLHSIDPEADFYLVCVTDTRVKKTVEHISAKKPLAVIAHTSGSLPVKILGKRVHGTGVFYPLQTFTREDNIDWKKIPVIIEAEDEVTRAGLRLLAREIGARPMIMTGAERLRMHLAAVLVNNFSNSLFVAARDITERSGTGYYDLLKPLIAKTAEKAITMDPRRVQTGPAKRGDKEILKKHGTVLAKHPELKKIYRQLSALIVRQQKQTDGEF